MNRSYDDDEHVCDQTPTFGTKLTAGTVVTMETAWTCEVDNTNSSQDLSANITALRLCNEQPTEDLKRQIEEEFGIRCQ